MTQYEWYTANVAVVGGSILGAVVLWDLIEEIKNDGR